MSRQRADIPSTWAWPECRDVEALQPGETAVWLVRLTGGDWDRERCWPHLSERERKRSERYTHPGANEEYVTSRALLRILLARYVGVEPLMLSFQVAPKGKPSLLEIAGKPTPRFNMTHSNGVGLYAFSIDQEVGVDVEMRERRANIEALAKRYFTERESGRILDRDASLRRDAFIRTWTCKEACLKWTGEGLSGGLKTHEILFSDAWDSPKAVGNGAQPVLHQLRPGEGWIGALAVDDAGVEVKGRVFRD